MIKLRSMLNLLNHSRLVEIGKLAQKDGVINGLLLHQGESNTNEKEWPNKVKAIFDTLGLADLDPWADIESATMAAEGPMAQISP